MYSLPIIPRLITSRTASWAMKRSYIKGLGNRLNQNAKTPGATWDGVTRHYSTIPISAIISFVASVVPALYCLLLTTKSTNANFSRGTSRWDDYNESAFKLRNHYYKKSYEKL